MALRQKIYERLLTKFKEEVCRNPDAVFDPRIKELAAEFSALEKRFIDELFLDLYDGDAHSLKMDLCELRASEPAEKTELPKPINLLKYLYKKLSSYIDKNYSTIIAVCNQGVGIEQEPYEMILSNFKEDVCRNPDADFIPYIKELAAEIYKRGKECEERVVNALFLNLYKQDSSSLESDLVRVRTVKPDKKAKPPERIVLLRGLCGALSSYIQEDFSDLIAMCERRMGDGA